MRDEVAPDARSAPSTPARGLVHVSDDEPGIARRGRSRFRYVRQDSGGEVHDQTTLERIASLAIPPAWTDVWICTDERGHIQATGRDDKGRKQYRYHAAFRARAERRKFDQLVPFGRALGKLRRSVDDDLRRHGLPRERVVAAALSVLELTAVRVGNEEYAATNRSYGLTTLRCRHIELDGSRLRMVFPGKGGKQVDVACCDARLARLVRRCQELPGQLLFQYEGEDGPAAITSTDINDYLRAVTGVDATAKTFRTWGGTLMAAQELATLQAPRSARAAASAIKAALEPVAAHLGNTVAVCRSSYVHPKVLSSFEDGSLAPRWSEGPTRPRARLTADERRLLRILESR